MTITWAAFLIPREIICLKELLNSCTSLESELSMFPPLFRSKNGSSWLRNFANSSHRIRFAVCSVRTNKEYK